MTDTTQEELPPLPEPSMLWPEGADKYYPPVFAYDKDDVTAYRDQCIATLKAENAALLVRLDKAHAGFRAEAEKLYGSIRELTAQLEAPVEEYAAKLLCVAQMADARAEAAQSQAAAMARLLEEARGLREALRCHGETVPCESCDCPMGAAARKFDAAIQREGDSK